MARVALKARATFPYDQPAAIAASEFRGDVPNKAKSDFPVDPSHPNEVVSNGESRETWSHGISLPLGRCNDTSIQTSNRPDVWSLGATDSCSEIAAHLCALADAPNFHPQVPLNWIPALRQQVLRAILFG